MSLRIRWQACVRPSDECQQRDSIHINDNRTAHILNIALAYFFL
jgi:hypothetical protein